MKITQTSTDQITKTDYELKTFGFTIIKLLIATVAFSIVLLAVIDSFVQISRVYYKGVNMSNTQDDSRNITQSIEDDFKYESTLPSNVNASGYFCMGRALSTELPGHVFSIRGPRKILFLWGGLTELFYP